MDIIYNCTKKVEEIASIIKNLSLKQDQACCDEDFDLLLADAERMLKETSKLHIAQREVLLSLYEGIPTYPKNIEAIESNAFSISIKVLPQYFFSVYKLTLPFLIPNKREKKIALKTAITNAVKAAISQFCKREHVTPLDNASIFYVSFYNGENLNVDNDNKESVLITNAMIGHLIRDDRASVCETIYCSNNRFDGSPKTDVYVVDKDYSIDIFTDIKRGIL